MSWQGEEVAGLIRQLQEKIFTYFLKENPHEYSYPRELHTVLDKVRSAEGWEPWKPKTLEERVKALEDKDIF